MPELPEVETIRRQLEKTVAGKKIKSVEIIDFRKKIQPKNLAERLKDLKIERLERRAKLLILKLSSGENLLIHLKLTGQLIYQKNKSPSTPPHLGRRISCLTSKKKESSLCQEGDNSTIRCGGKFTHAIFNFTDGSRLLFNDMRKFGYLMLTDKNGLERLKTEFGVEPLSKEFNLAKFKEILARRPNQKIKQLLMEQNLIAGIGNIYSDETLFAAGILPTRLAKSLKEGEKKKLWRVIPVILKKSIEAGGTSADTYVDAYGREGAFARQLKVYGREGEKCGRCGGIVRRLKIGGRSAHYCPRCQN